MNGLFTIGPDGKLVPTRQLEGPFPEPLAGVEPAQAQPATPPPTPDSSKAWMNPQPTNLRKQLQEKYGSSPAWNDDELVEAQRQDRFSSTANRMGNLMTSAWFQASGMQPPNMPAAPSRVADLAERRKLLAERMGLGKAMREEQASEQELALKTQQMEESRDAGSGRSRNARATRDIMVGIMQKSGMDPTKYGINMDPNATFEQLAPQLELLEKAAGITSAEAVARYNAEATRNLQVAGWKHDASKAVGTVPGYTWTGGPMAYPDPATQKTFNDARADQERRRLAVEELKVAVDNVARNPSPATAEAARHAREKLVQAEAEAAQKAGNPKAAEAMSKLIPEFGTADNVWSAGTGGLPTAAKAYSAKLDHYLAAEQAKVEALARAAGYAPEARTAGPTGPGRPAGHGAAPKGTVLMTDKNGKSWNVPSDKVAVYEKNGFARAATKTAGAH